MTEWFKGFAEMTWGRDLSTSTASTDGQEDAYLAAARFNSLSQLLWDCMIYRG